MDKFTKINLNGVEKFVSAIYDGSGNNITETYETIQHVSEKETELSDRITAVSEALASLTTRVAATEEYPTTIVKNTEGIAANSDAIKNLQDKDLTLTQSLDTLTIKVGENSASITTLQTSSGSLSTSVVSLSNKVETLTALVNDEATGIDALNNQADQNTAAIATKVSQQTYNEKVAELTNAISGKANKTAFDALLARVVALEEALAANHPVDLPSPEEGGDA